MSFKRVTDSKLKNIVNKKDTILNTHKEYIILY